jgi:hypothetical protein
LSAKPKRKPPVKKRPARRKKSAAAKPAAKRPAKPAVTCVEPEDDSASSAPSGRPTSFRPEFVAQARKLCELGATDADLADFFNVNRSTIHRWQSAEPAFREALQLGKAAADDRVVRALYNRATGYSHEAVKIFLPKDSAQPVLVPYIEHFPPDTTACIFWLKNRRKDDWRDVQKHEHTGEDGGPIETRELSDLEAARRIAFILDKAARQQDGDAAGGPAGQGAGSTGGQEGGG